MKKFFFIIVLTLSACAESSHRKKRNIFQFADMINCVTGRWPLLSYGNYGCFCGLGGQGDPVDKIDRCCAVHDRCYSTLVANGTCGRLDTYITAYSYETSDCQTEKATVSCGINEDDCASSMCNCDRDAVMCFMEHDELYNVQFIFYDTWWSPQC